MTDLKFFMGLLTLVTSAEEELGLQGLSQKDKQVLQALWTQKDNTQCIDMTYETFCQLSDQTSISRSQYFKSIQKLLEKHLIERVGTPRSHTFKFVS